MKTLLTVIAAFILLITQNLLAKTNISHAIAMHGEPKYDQNFISVEYVSNNAEKGGNIVAQGTPEEIILNKDSYTGKYLKKIIS